MYLPCVSKIPGKEQVYVPSRGSVELFLLEQALHLGRSPEVKAAETVWIIDHDQDHQHTIDDQVQAWQAGEVGSQEFDEEHKGESDRDATPQAAPAANIGYCQHLNGF